MPKTPRSPLRRDNIFTTEEKELIRAAEASFMTLTRSFEAWTDIGWAVLAVDDAVARMGLKTLRARQTAFYDLLATTKLRSIVNRQQRSLLSKLRAIMRRLDEVAAWRATLTANQRIAWAGPLSVWLNCPAFHPRGKPVFERPPTLRASLAVIRGENEQLRARVAELQEELQEERGGGPAEMVTPAEDHVALALVEHESADEEQPGNLRNITQRIATKTGIEAPTVAAEADEDDQDGHDGDVPARFTSYDKADKIGDRIVAALKGTPNKLDDVVAHVFTKGGNTGKLNVCKILAAVLNSLDGPNRVYAALTFLHWLTDGGSSLVKDKRGLVASRLNAVVALADRDMVTKDTLLAQLKTLEPEAMNALVIHMLTHGWHGQSDCGDATRSGIIERMMELADDPQQMMAAALQHLAEKKITDVPELLGHLCQKFSIKVDAKTGAMALPKKKAKRSRTKTVQQTGKLGEVVADAFGELREMAEEVREVVKKSERFAGTQRIQTLEETADALEGIDRPEVPNAIKDLPVTYNEVQSTRKGRGLSRAISCAVAVKMLRAAANVVEASENEEVVEFRDAIEEAAETADACEFPGW
jgi:hypothetical protein